jgi:hypothetical protein
MNARTSLLVVTVFLGVPRLFAAAPEVIKLDDFRKELPKVARKILDVVEGERAAAVAVGRFSGPAQFDTNAGPGIEEMLSQALETERKGVVQKKAEISVQGSFAIVDDTVNFGRILVKMRVEVLNREADPIKQFIAELRNNRDIAALSGATTSLPPDGSKDERNRKLKDSLNQPKVHVEGPLVKASPESQFAVEIRAKHKDDRGEAKPRAASIVDGQAFVDVKRDEVYEVVVHNKSGKEAAVSIAIDGLDVFTFSELRNEKTGAPKYSHYVISPGTASATVGWHLRDQPPNNYSSFLVTELGKGASARAPRPAVGKIGVLTVSFAFCFPAGSNRSGSETGFGPPRSVKIEPVQRDIDPPHEFVTIRYTR